jgi:riboflavin synthase
MFTGIVEGIGRVVALELAPDHSGARLEVEASWLDGGLLVGDSVAVDGCCLTVTELGGGRFVADVMAESLRRTALGRRRPGDQVNLERPLALGERLGGHLVQGHVDGLGRVLSRTALGQGPGGEQSEHIRIGLDDPDLARYLVVKGSVAVNGVSLTVADAGPGWFTVALIPHTLRATNLGRLREGDEVQLEVDVLAKYVERLLEGVPGGDRR